MYATYPITEKADLRKFAHKALLENKAIILKCSGFNICVEYKKLDENTNIIVTLSGVKDPECKYFDTFEDYIEYIESVYDKNINIMR